MNNEGKMLLLGHSAKTIVDTVLTDGASKGANLLTKPKLFGPRNLDDNIGLPGDLDFLGGTFDTVVSCGWHEVCPWLRWSLQEVHRVLKTGGRFVAVLPVSNLLVCGQAEGKQPPNLLWRTLNILRGKISNQVESYGLLEPVLSELGFKIDAISSVGPPAARPFSVKLKIQKVDFSVPNVGAKDYVLVSATKIHNDWRTNPLYLNWNSVREMVLRDFQSRLDSREEFKERHVLNAFKADALDSIASLGPKALILSPHPDDEVIGVGGTMLWMKEKGLDVTVIQLTNGCTCAVLDNQPLKLRREVRLAEARRVAAKAGIEMYSCDADDGLKNEDLDKLKNYVSSYLTLHQPDSIFVPALNDPHKDHQLANRILKDALIETGQNPVVFQYEVWSFCNPNVFHDYSTFSDQKADLLQIYRTALRSVNYQRISTLVASWNAFRMTKRPGQLEVFFMTGADEYISLCEREYGD